jgi:hypothetical protein
MEVDQPSAAVGAVGGENGNVAGEGAAAAAAVAAGVVGMETESSGGGGSGVSVMAASGTSGSITVSVHPLVIMNVSEHWTRARAQNDGKSEAGTCHRLNEE